MAVTDRTKGKKGISAFIVRARHAGLPCGQEGGQAGRALLRHLRAGLRGLPRAGGEPARAARATASSTPCRSSTAGRIGIAAWSRRASRRPALEASMKYAQGAARSSGTPIAEFQAIQFKIADMATKVERGAAAHLAAPRALRDAGQEHTIESSMAKLFAERDRGRGRARRRCRSTAATATSRTTRWSATCATASSARSARARARSSAWSSRASCCTSGMVR